MSRHDNRQPRAASGRWVPDTSGRDQVPTPPVYVPARLRTPDDEDAQLRLEEAYANLQTCMHCGIPLRPGMEVCNDCLREYGDPAVAYCTDCGTYLGPGDEDADGCPVCDPDPSDSDW